MWNNGTSTAGSKIDASSGQETETLHGVAY